MNQIRKLGVDFGGVISENLDRTDDTSLFGDKFLDAPERPGAFDALRSLHDETDYGDNMWIVSKCGEKIQARTKLWLDHHDFYGRTGMDRSHVRFTPTRDGKADIAKELGLTDFVDDKLEVLGYVAPVVGRLILHNADPEEVNAHREALGEAITRVIEVNDWQRLQHVLAQKPQG